MANHISHAALPFPVKNARFTILVPYLDADGDPTDPTTPDTEVSIDAGAYADTAEEVTTITGSNGSGYITLTGAETNGSGIFVCAKVASGPKATLFTGYPRVLPVLVSGTLTAGSSSGGTLAEAIGYDLRGCIVKTTGGTGGGGTGGANNQARVIITSTLATGAFTVSPNFETAVSTDTTVEILLTEMAYVKSVGSGGLTAASIAADAITAAKIAAGAIDRATFAADTGLQTIRSNTAASGSASGIVLDASASAVDDFYNGKLIFLTGGTGAGQVRMIRDYTGSTQAVLLHASWQTTPDNTSTFAILPAGPAELFSWNNETTTMSGLSSMAADYLSGYVTARIQGLTAYAATIGATGNDSTHIHLDNVTQGNDEINDTLLVVYDNSEGEYHSRWVDDWVASTKLATIATLPFTPEASVDRVWLLGIRRDAVFLGTDAITSTSLAASAVTEIQSGLATSSALATAQTSIDDLPTNAELATALGTADDAVLAQVAIVAAYVDTEVAAIKAKTDLIPAAPASTTNITAASGVVLGATGLDSISAAMPNGVASTFAGRLMQLWGKMFYREEKTSTTITQYRSDATTVNTTQTISTSGANQSKGAAS